MGMFYMVKHTELTLVSTSNCFEKSHINCLFKAICWIFMIKNTFSRWEIYAECSQIIQLLWIVSNLFLFFRKCFYSLLVGAVSFGVFVAPVLPSNKIFFSWIAMAENIKGMTAETCAFIACR